MIVMTKLYRGIRDPEPALSLPCPRLCKPSLTRTRFTREARCAACASPFALERHFFSRTPLHTAASHRSLIGLRFD